MGANATPPVETQQSLQAKLDAEQAAHQATKDGLTAEQTAHQDTKGALEAEQSAHLDTKNEAAEIIAGQTQTIEEQQAKIIQLQADPAEFPSITIGEDEYEVRAKSFKYKGREYVVAELLGDASLQKELVEKGMGFLVKKSA